MFGMIVAYFVSLWFQLKQLEEAIMEDQRKAMRRFNERRAVADLQLLQ